MTQPPEPEEERPTQQAALLLAIVGSFFFLSYAFANWHASRLEAVPSFVFAWERFIPFWPWTIVPYWSITPLYIAAFFVCRRREELHSHAKRVLLAQLISVAFFLWLPLRCTFERPEVPGLFGHFFAFHEFFDEPFNQAPSLHVSLLLLSWRRCAAHLGPRGRVLLHAWSALILVSVLTTWQHQAIDVPTGFAVGALCLIVFPEQTKRISARAPAPAR